MKFDIKTIITLGTLLFAIAGFYYTTKNDVYSLSLKVQALESENRLQQRRLDSLDRKAFKLNKQLKQLKKQN